jgi:hypothetical protein
MKATKVYTIKKKKEITTYIRFKKKDKKYDVLIVRKKNKN